MRRRVPTLACVLLAALSGLPATAQTATVAVPEENFRAAPGGEVIARLYEGAPLVLGGARDRWREATLEAWIWDASVGPYGQAVLVNAGGENLRASPNGERLGRAEGGMRLEPVGREGDWLRVRRTAWIWAPSLDESAATEGASTGSRVPDDDPAARGPATASRRSSAREYATVGSGSVLRDRPGGDSIARLRPGTSVELLDREGDWTRIRIEGWTRALDFEEVGDPAVLVDIGRDPLQAHPTRHRGRMVEWTVQFISLQRAEAFRTDFVEGEPFLLARGPGDDDGFVYVAVPADRLPVVEALSPLQQIRILARVRTVRSGLTGAPIVELHELIR